MLFLILGYDVTDVPAEEPILTCCGPVPLVKGSAMYKMFLEQLVWTPLALIDALRASRCMNRFAGCLCCSYLMLFLCGAWAVWTANA